MKIIDGKKLAEKIKDDITKEIFNLGGDRPNLAIILVGEREDSKLYVNLKEKEAKKVGIDTHLYKCPDNITEDKLLETIDFLNNDETVDAILIQLPLPKEIDTHKIIESIDPSKDIDSFHSINLKKLADKTIEEKFTPPVFDVVLEMLKDIKYDLNNKNVCIIANAEIFEENLADLLNQYGAKVKLAKYEDPELIEKTKKADVLITAVGKPRFITKEMIKENAVIIDIGICKDEENKTCGDVNFEDVEQKAGYISPVPGGVGPMTIAMAFKNTLLAYKQKH